MTAPTPTSRDLAALLAAHAAATFRCPGDEYTINRAVHLARLASGYEPCRLCPHREDLAGDPSAHPERGPVTLSLAVRDALFASGYGLRGRYLNDLSRTSLGDWATLVALRFQRQPRTSGAAQPALVVGHDARASSPDLVAGVVHGLRRGGCEVLDVGLVPQPTAWFAMSRHRAQGVVYVTGAGCDVSWNGLDVTAAGPRPWTRADWPTPGDVPGLTSTLTGEIRGHFSALRHEASAYVHWLRSALHGVRPLRFVLAAPHLPQRRLIEQLFATQALRLSWLDCGPRPLADRVEDDPDLTRLIAAVREGRADFGALLHEDGFGVTLFDETGAVVLVSAQAQFLDATPSPDPARSAHLWLPNPIPVTIDPVTADPIANEHPGHPESHHTAPSLVCDGIVTLLALIGRLSESDIPLSQRLALK